MVKAMREKMLKSVNDFPLTFCDLRVELSIFLFDDEEQMKLLKIHTNTTVLD